MGVWFTKNLGDAMMASEGLDRIESLFRASYRTGSPQDAGIFTRHESEGRLHCEVRAYFSPATATLAKGLGATPCEKPSPNGLGLLVGDEACWPSLFPERAG